MRFCERILGSHPEAAALIRERRLSGPYDVEALRALPPGSLGQIRDGAGCPRLRHQLLPGAVVFSEP